MTTVLSGQDAGEQRFPAPVDERELLAKIPADGLPIVAMRDAVLFPGMILPLTIGREQSILAAQYAVRAEGPIGVLMQKNPEVEVPQPDDFFSIGTVAVILRYVTLPDGTHVIVCQGQQRFGVSEYLKSYPFTVARRS